MQRRFLQQQHPQPETRHEGHTWLLSDINLSCVSACDYSQVTCRSTSTKDTSLLQQRGVILDSDHETTFLFPLETVKEEKNEEWAHMAADPNIPVAAPGILGRYKYAGALCQECLCFFHLRFNVDDYCSTVI